MPARSIAAVATIAIALATSACSFKSGGLGAAVDSSACTNDCDAGADAAEVETPDALDDTPPPPPTGFTGAIVGAAVNGRAGGVQLTGACNWGAAVHGSSGGITLEGSLQ